MTYLISRVSPWGLRRWTYQSWRSKGGSELQLVSKGTIMIAEVAHVYLAGYIRPKNSTILALGVISFGLP